ncbi:MAG: hypothetical protein IVW57_16990, partial [Ktedonobacterales bacterium]|nr:hypothetical protein [Ktedonobacterales bacterium]
LPLGVEAAATTGAFMASLPPQLPPLPVRADLLPRIEWANEPLVNAPPSAPTLAELAPAVGAAAQSTPASSPASEESGPAVVPTLTASMAAIKDWPAGPMDEASRSAPVSQPEMDAPLVPAQFSTTSTPAATSGPEAGAPLADASGAVAPALAPAIEPGPPTIPRPGRMTRPLAAITHPLAPSSEPSPSSGGTLWDRLSQALLGVSPIAPPSAAPGTTAPETADAAPASGEERGAVAP